jgi:hypothetical protein
MTKKGSVRSKILPLGTLGRPTFQQDVLNQIPQRDARLERSLIHFHLKGPRSVEYLVA